MSSRLLELGVVSIRSDLAVVFGLERAVILRQMAWLESQIGIDEGGRRWLVRTIAELLMEFPWVSDRTLRRRLAELEQAGFIIVKQPGGRDRTAWYSINGEVVDAKLEEAGIIRSGGYVHMQPADLPDVPITGDRRSSPTESPESETDTPDLVLEPEKPDPPELGEATTAWQGTLDQLQGEGVCFTRRVTSATLRAWLRKAAVRGLPLVDAPAMFAWAAGQRWWRGELSSMMSWSQPARLLRLRNEWLASLRPDGDEPRGRAIPDLAPQLAGWD